MPPSRGNNPAGASREKLAEWETRAFQKLKEHRNATTPVDDELPDELLADLEETRSALERVRGR